MGAKVTTREGSVKPGSPDPIVIPNGQSPKINTVRRPKTSKK